MRNLGMLAKRLKAVEQRRRSRRPVFVWRNMDESADAAIARHLAEHPADANRRIHVIGRGRSRSYCAPGPPLRRSRIAALPARPIATWPDGTGFRDA